MAARYIKPSIGDHGDIAVAKRLGARDQLAHRAQLEVDAADAGKAAMDRQREGHRGHQDLLAVDLIGVGLDRDRVAGRLGQLVIVACALLFIIGERGMRDLARLAAREIGHIATRRIVARRVHMLCVLTVEGIGLEADPGPENARMIGQRLLQEGVEGGPVGRA